MRPILSLQSVISISRGVFVADVQDLKLSFSNLNLFLSWTFDHLLFQSKYIFSESWKWIIIWKLDGLRLIVVQYELLYLFCNFQKHWVDSESSTISHAYVFRINVAVLLIYVSGCTELKVLSD